MFPTQLGTPTDPRNALRALVKIAERTELAETTLHTLRHSAGSALVARGVHMKIVQEVLRHSSYTITADIYAHVRPRLKRNAIEAMNRALHDDEDDSEPDTGSEDDETPTATP